MVDIQWLKCFGGLMPFQVSIIRMKLFWNRSKIMDIRYTSEKCLIIKLEKKVWLLKIYGQLLDQILVIRWMIKLPLYGSP